MELPGKDLEHMVTRYYIRGDVLRHPYYHMKTLVHIRVGIYNDSAGSGA